MRQRRAGGRLGRRARGAVAVVAAGVTLAACDSGTAPSIPAGVRLELAVQPHDVVTGFPFDSVISVRVVDAAGMPLTDVTDDVSVGLRVTGGSATLSGPTRVPLSGGVASFPGIAAAGSTPGARLVATWRDLEAESEPFAVVPSPDLADVPGSGVAGVDAALLVDGVLGGYARNDSIFRAGPGLLPVGAVRATQQRNEILAFVPGYAPAQAPAPWTVGVDTVVVSLRETVHLPVTIWVVYGPFPEAESEIATDVEATNRLFADQYAGIHIDARIVDVTEDPRATDFLDPDAPAREAGMDSLGFTTGRINVYAVRNILFSEDEVTLGFAEIGGDMMLMAKLGWGRSTFAHEVGHALGLEHVNDREGFGAENLMVAGGSPDRFALTEGQTFRMHYDRRTALHTVIGLVPLEDTRGCGSATGFHSAGCPLEELRLFDDGTSQNSAAAGSLEAYLSWDCARGAPPRPDLDPALWRRLVLEDPPEAEAMRGFARVRALAAWAASDPAGARPTLLTLAEEEEGVLRVTARALLKAGPPGPEAARRTDRRHRSPW